MKATKYLIIYIFFLINTACNHKIAFPVTEVDKPVSLPATYTNIGVGTNAINYLLPNPEKCFIKERNVLVNIKSPSYVIKNRLELIPFLPRIRYNLIKPDSTYIETGNLSKSNWFVEMGYSQIKIQGKWISSNFGIRSSYKRKLNTITWLDINAGMESGYIRFGDRSSTDLYLDANVGYMFSDHLYSVFGLNTFILSQTVFQDDDRLYNSILGTNNSKFAGAHIKIGYNTNARINFFFDLVNGYVYYNYDDLNERYYFLSFDITNRHRFFGSCSFGFNYTF